MQAVKMSQQSSLIRVYLPAIRLHVIDGTVVLVNQ